MGNPDGPLEVRRNGREFANGLQRLRDVLRAAPGVEVKDRLSRRGRIVMLKDTDISTYTRVQIRKIQDWMNALHRKILDGLSAQGSVQQYFQESAA